MWLAFLLSFRSDSDPHLDSAYATSQYCFLFFQHKFCLILCRAVASDEDFESTVFTFYTLIFCQEAKLFFCDFEDDFGFFSRLKGYLAEIFQLFHRAYHGCGYVVDVKLSWLGIAYVLDEDNDLYTRMNKEMVFSEEISNKYDVMELKDMIKEHVALTNSEKGKKILDNFSEYLPKFKKVIPYDYNRMLMAIVQMEEKGLSSEQAQIEAFYANTRG